MNFNICRLTSSFVALIVLQGCVSLTSIKDLGLVGQTPTMSPAPAERLVIDRRSFRGAARGGGAVVEIKRCDHADRGGEVQRSFIVAFESGQVLLWDEKSGKTASLGVTLGRQPTIAVNSDCSLLAYTSSTTRLAIVTLQKGEVREFPADRLRARVTALTFNPEGGALLIGAADGQVYRWRFRDEEHVSDIAERSRMFERYSGHGAVVSGVAYHPVGRVFFSADWLGGIISWLGYDADPQGGEYDQNLFGGQFYLDHSLRSVRSAGGGNGAEQIALSNDGTVLFAGFQHGVLEWWEVRGFRKRAEVAGHRGVVRSIEPEDSTDRVLSVGRDQMIRRWQLITEPVVFPDPPVYRFQMVAERAVPGVRIARWLGSNKVLAGLDSGELVVHDISEPVPAVGGGGQ